MKLLQTRLQPKNMKINYYDLYQTVIKNRDDKENVNDHYENNENDYYNYDEIITPNHYIGIKNIDEFLK